MSILIEHSFSASAQDLWAIVGTPDRIDWVPGVAACKYDGDVRRLSMPGAGEIAERILALEDDHMRIEYSCIESQPPLAKHLAEIQVVTDGQHSCTMIWKTEVEPVEVEPFIRKSMDGCLARLEQLLNGEEPS